MEFVDYYLSDDKLKSYNIFNPLMVKKLIDKLSKMDEASEFDNMALVGILTTQIFYDQFIENYDEHLIKPLIFDIAFDGRSSHSNDLLSHEIKLLN